MISRTTTDGSASTWILAADLDCGIIQKRALSLVQYSVCVGFFSQGPVEVVFARRFDDGYSSRA